MQHRKPKAIIICVSSLIIYLLIAYSFRFQIDSWVSLLIVFVLILTYRRIVTSPSPQTIEEKRQLAIVKYFKNKISNITDKDILVNEFVIIESATNDFYKEYRNELVLLIDAIKFAYNINDENTFIINPPNNLETIICVRCNNKFTLTHKSDDENKIICNKCSAKLIWGIPKPKEEKLRKDNTKIDNIFLCSNCNSILILDEQEIESKTFICENCKTINTI